LLLTQLTPSKGESAESLDELMAKARSAGAITGMDDFLERAAALAREMSQRSNVSAVNARNLMAAAELIRGALESGVDRGMLLNAVGAGLIFANLANEKRSGENVKSRGVKSPDSEAPITAARYWRAAREVEASGERITDERVADKLGKSSKAVTEWRKKHLEP
jgi:hypothetical protein